MFRTSCFTANMLWFFDKCSSLQNSRHVAHKLYTSTLFINLAQLLHHVRRMPRSMQTTFLVALLAIDILKGWLPSEYVTNVTSIFEAVQVANCQCQFHPQSSEDYYGSDPPQCVVHWYRAILSSYLWFGSLFTSRSQFWMCSALC